MRDFGFWMRIWDNGTHAAISGLLNRAARIAYPRISYYIPYLVSRILYHVSIAYLVSHILHLATRISHLSYIGIPYHASRIPYHLAIIIATL